MPYKSLKQEHMFHYLESKGRIKPSVVKEWDAATKGKKLPLKKKYEGGAVSPLGIALSSMRTKP